MLRTASALGSRSSRRTKRSGFGGRRIATLTLRRVAPLLCSLFRVVIPPHTLARKMRLEILRGVKSWNTMVENAARRAEPTEERPSFACSTSRMWVAPLTFWFSDLHDGTRVDHPSILLELGHRVVQAGRKGSMTIAPWVFENVTVLPTSSLSKQVLAYGRHFHELDEKLVAAQFEQYMRLPLMAEVSAFVCAFPSAMCDQYLGFNRSIVWAPAHRYSHGRCATGSWQRHSARLQRAFERPPRPLGSPPHFVAAMSVYDAEYLHYYLGRRPLLLEATSLGYAPSMASSRGPDTHASPLPVLVGPLQQTRASLAACAPWLVKPEVERASGLNFSTAKAFYGKYSLAAVSKHPAAVVLPYAVMSYGLTELYALNVPLFAPTLELSARLRSHLFYDRRHNKPPGCRESAETQPPKHPDAPHPFSPEDDSVEARRHWLQFADVFQWPHVTYFESFDELASKLRQADLRATRRAMAAHNAVRHARVRDAWAEVAAEIRAAGSPRALPSGTHEQALRTLTGETAVA